MLISDKLKRLFVDARLAGFERLDPVEFVKMKRHKPEAGDPPGYWLASIQRSQMALDETASGLDREKEPTCEECRTGGVIKRLDRIVLQGNPSPCEDVFFARGLPGTILVNERFKRLCEANALTNCVLVAAEHFSFDHYPLEHSIGGRRH